MLGIHTFTAYLFLSIFICASTRERDRVCNDIWDIRIYSRCKSTIFQATNMSIEKRARIHPPARHLETDCNM